MNSRVANVIAVELGLLIAVLVWLALSRLPSVPVHLATGDQARTEGSVATLAPLLKPRSQNLYADGTGRGGSIQAAEELMPAAPEYVQELAPEPYAGSDYAQDFVAEASPSYAAIEPVPVLSSPECYAAPIGQIVTFVQPRPIVVFSSSRLIRRPNRSSTRFGGGRANAGHQRPGDGGLPMRGGGLTPRHNPNGGLASGQNASARLGRQNQALKPHWNP